MEAGQDREAHGITLEQTHVYNVYEKTARHFADIHQRAWPKVKRFLQDLEPGSVVADVGCGTGKYLSINKDVYMVGSDRCHGLVDIARCQGEGQEVMTCDNLSLPFRDASLDAVISISVIHHFSTKRRRISALCELARTLRLGGKVLIYVMAMEQHLRKFESQDVLVPWHFQPDSKLPKGASSRSSSTSSLSDEEVEDCLQDEPWTAAIASKHSNGHSGKPAVVSSTYSPIHLQPLTFSRGKFEKSHSMPTPVSVTASPVNDRPHLTNHKQRATSFSESFKNKLFGLFTKSEENESSKLEETLSKKHRAQLDKDLHYKKLLDYIMREEMELLNQSTSGMGNSHPVFAVREFPSSSRMPDGAVNGDELQHTGGSLNDRDEQDVRESSSSARLASNGVISTSYHTDPYASTPSKSVHMTAVPSPAKPSAFISYNGQCESEGVKYCSYGVYASENVHYNGNYESDSVKCDADSVKCDTVSVKCESDSVKVSLDGNSPDDDDVFDDSESESETWPGLNGVNDLDSGLHDWIETTQNAIEVMQMKLNSDVKEEVLYQSSKMQAVMRYRDRVMHRLSNISSPDASSNTSDNDINSHFSSETSSISDDTWSEADDLDIADQLDISIPDNQTDNLTDIPDPVNSATPQDDVNPTTQCYRYYHVFKEGELRDLIEKHVKSLNIIKAYYDHANWCIVAEKI